MWRAAVLCSGVLTALSCPAAAQSVIGLRELVRGTLEAGDRVSADGRIYDCYRLRLNRGEWVAITLSSARFDAWVEAGPGTSCEFSSRVESDDDGAGYPNARLTVRPGPRTHFLRVSSYSRGETGDYYLIVVPSDAPPAGGPNPFRSGTSEASLPFEWYDWVRPKEATARYRWDAMCVAVNWVTRHERVAGPTATLGQVEEETALLTATLRDSAHLAGQTDDDAEEAWKAWTGAAMSLSHDGMIVPHPLTISLQRSCVKQLRVNRSPAGRSSLANDRSLIR